MNSQTMKMVRVRICRLSSATLAPVTSPMAKVMPAAARVKIPHDAPTSAEKATRRVTLPA